MVGDGQPKTQVSKKRRHDRDACLNNLKLNVNVRDSKRHARQQQQQQPDNATYTKRTNRKLIQGSLENVSTNPWGEGGQLAEEPSSLRRSRSLAISRETIFTSLDFSRASAAAAQNRRSQLIPRAKLIDRSGAREQRYKGSSVENLEATGKRPASKSRPESNPPAHHQVQNKSRRSRRTQRDDEIYAYASLNNINDKNIWDVEQDRLGPYFKNKSTSNNLYRASYEDLQELSLPNYYPDSKCDTDFTDNISIYENTSCVSLDTNNNVAKPSSSIVGRTKYSSTGNISNINWEISGPESIPYDENILLSAKKSYSDNNYAKPKTIRGPTPYHENYTYNKRRNSVSQANYEKPSQDISQRNEEDINVSYFETNKKLEESETAKVISIHEGDNYDNIENNPVYGKLVSKKNIEVSPLKTNKKEQTITETADPIRTLIEVPAEINNESDEQYKTIVAVESENTTSEEDSKSNKSKQHSHNYLREFLETQKGSKKPLQNFIAKKLSNLSRRNFKDNQSLSENQFLSLPDISVSENLKKCEKIDKKLRKCEKDKSNSKENRFIVNIGRHFDITANANIPVDFEVKIAKVPKKNKSVKKKPVRKEKSDKQLIEAVRNLKQTLSASSISLDENYRPSEILESKEDFLDKDKDELEIEMEKTECTKEYKEKVDTMRNYWGKIADTENINDIEEEGLTCKIIDLQTKVEDVKKRFEPQEPEEKPFNKVTLVKQLFEVNAPEKREKISPLIKENCSYFERNPRKNIFFDSDAIQLESLNPNIVEIIDKNTNKEEKYDKPKSNHQKRTLSKSNSTGYPEFDHVRYRVVKSDLFQKKIFANCDKESQFEGLMQYLQDYSFQELLIDNNIVIIEPIRSKVQYEPVKTSKKISTNVTPLLQKINNDDDANSLRKHFFYHPIRVNKEVNDDELPNPDTVRQVRQFFECGLKRSQSNQEIENSGKEKYGKDDPDKDHCSATDSNSNPSNISDFGSQENLFDDDVETENCCEQQFVSEDILEKIRECGSTITYYGGRVVKQDNGQPVLTKAIMREIRNNERRSCSCKKSGENKDDNDIYEGVKFKLVKSNSCSSRVELVGTKNLSDSKKKYFARYKKLLEDRNQKNETNTCIKEEMNENDNSQTQSDNLQIQTITDKNAINESIRQSSINHQPKIIGEEMKIKDNKLVQWGDVKKEKIYSSITYSDKSNQKNYYEFHNYDKIQANPHKPEMEFEPYEVA